MTKMSMTPRQRIMAALRNEYPDKIPFAPYWNFIPRSATERNLRNRGLCLVDGYASFKVFRPNVQTKAIHYTDEKRRKLIRTIYSTPHGELSTLVEPAGFTDWTHEHLFKTPDDFKALLYMVNDTVIEPNYDFVAKKMSDLGEDFLVRDEWPYEPMQEIIYSFMGTETFCYEWADNRDEILKLYHAISEKRRKIYQIASKSPLEVVKYGGNVVPQLIGVENFKKYYIPVYNEAAEILHKSGKLLGCHFDADNTLIMDQIAKTDLDFIEAYDPSISPSVKNARKAWPDKALWLNFPSGWHIEQPDVIKARTLKMLEDAYPGNGFIIGVTEDIPEDHYQQNFMAIMDAIDEFDFSCN